MMDYSEVPGLEGLYLEDSYVLSIAVEREALVFRLDAVLTPLHPAYGPPAQGEQYCYRRGRLIFDKPRDVARLFGSTVPNIDANGETDLGNIDSMTVEGGLANLEGEWGAVRVVLSQAPRFILDSEVLP